MALILARETENELKGYKLWVSCSPMNPANYVNIYASAREEKNYGPSFRRTNYVNIYVSAREKKIIDLHSGEQI